MTIVHCVDATCSLNDGDICSAKEIKNHGPKCNVKTEIQNAYFDAQEIVIEKYQNEIDILYQKNLSKLKD